MKLLPFLLASLMTAMALAGCLGGDDKDDDSDQDTTNGDQMDGNVTMPLTNLTVQPDEANPTNLPSLYSWIPANLSAPVNTTVNLTIISPSGATGNQLTHSFVIDELNVTVNDIAPGDRENVMFNVTAPGSYVYYCDVGNHREQGMVGTLTVE